MFGQWNVYWTSFNEIKERSAHAVIVKIIKFILKKLSELVGRDGKGDGVAKESLLDFYYDYHNMIRKLTKKPDKLRYFLEIASVIDVRYFGANYAEDDIVSIVPYPAIKSVQSI